MIRYVLVLTLVCACGDNTAPPGGDDTPDAGTPAPRAVVVSGTFTPGEPGVMATLDVDTLELTPQVAPNGAIAEDPMIRRFGDELFVVNRASGNNVTILDARSFTVVEQLATGAGSNPQDVAVVGDKLYVPGFTTAGVVVLARGTQTMAAVDLSSLDPDGQPNCISALAVGADVYVVCELLDANFSARGPGKVVVIDSATDTVRATLTLTNKNPFGVLERVPEGFMNAGDLVVPTVPDFGDLTKGCVEHITPGATPVAAGCFMNLTNADVKGYVGRINFQLLGSAQVMWLVVESFDAMFNPSGNVQAYDLQTNCLWSAPITPATEILVDATVCPNDVLVVADQTMAANGLRVYEGTAETTPMPLAIGLKPGSSHGLVCY